MPTSLRSSLLGLCTLTVLLGTSSCVKEYNFEQTQTETGSLGEEAHAILLKDAQRAKNNAESKSALLEAKRTDFILALDTMVPESQLAPVDLFLQQSLPMIDDKSLPVLSQKLTLTLDDARADQDLLGALGKLESRGQVSDFISPTNPPDLIGYLVDYPNLRDLGLRSAKLVLDNDGFRDDGVRNVEESEGVSELVRVLSDELAKVDANSLDDSIALIVRDLLVKQDDRFDNSDGKSPLYVATFDRRGSPRLRADVLAKFRDDDNDNLPDLDTDGNLLMLDGSSVSRQAFATTDSPNISRDVFGRASLDADGFVYDYVDLNKTGLGFLIRIYADLSKDDVFIDLFDSLKILLGPTTILEDERGKYEAFSPDNPLIDLTYGGVRALAYPEMPTLMSDMAELFRLASGELASLVVGLERFLDAVDNNPEAVLGDNQTIPYDLLPILQEIAQDKKLWNDMFDALANPMTPKLGDAMITLMSYKNTIADPKLGGTYDTCFQQCKVDHTIGTPERFDCIRSCPNSEIFQQPFDPNAPESLENQSQLQAMWYLIWSLDGIRYEMAVEKILVNGKPGPEVSPLLVFDNASASFIRAIAGNMNLEESIPRTFFEDDDLGKLLNYLGIDSANVVAVLGQISRLFFDVEYNGVPFGLVKNPGADDLSRIFTRKDLVWSSDDGKYLLDIREPINRDGYFWHEHSADGLLEMEAAGMIDAFYPLAKAFSDNNKEPLLINMLSVFHRHWSGNKELYKKKNGLLTDTNPANVRSFEPMLKEVLEEGSLLKSLALLTTRVKSLKDSDRFDLAESLRLMVLHGTTPDALTTRSGDDFLNIADGRTERNLTPLHLVFASFGDLLDRLDEKPAAKAQFNDALGNLLNVALAADWPQGQPKASFKDDASIAFSQQLMAYLSDRAKAQPQLESWLKNDLYQDIFDIWTSRLLSGLVRIAEQLLENDDNRKVFDDVIDYMTGNPQGQRNTTLISYELVVRSVDTETWVPLAKFLSKAIDPDRNWGLEGEPRAQLPILSHGSIVLQRVLEQDNDGVGADLIRRAVKKRGFDDPSPLSEVADILADFWRVDPALAGQPFATEDYVAFLDQLIQWMRNQEEGLGRLYDLVGLRVK